MKKTLLNSVLLLLLLGAATGCSRYYWSKPGASGEQFTQDNQACVQQAAGTVPAAAASLDAVRQYYRACLSSRGYVRDKQMDPPPPGSYRGIENSEEFNAAAQAAMAQAPRQTFEQQLTQLDDLKARGRITDTEYAAMRQRLVEGVTPGALTPPPAPPAPPAAAATPPRQLAGRWYGRNGSTLDIREDGRTVQWDWELLGVTTLRAAGTGSVSGNQISLVGRPTAGMATASAPSYAFTLTWEGDVMRGTSTGPNNLPVSVEFRRERP